MKARNSFLAGIAVFAAAGAFASLESDVAFILEYAPPQHMPALLQSVTNNCALAAAARETAIESYPDEIYLDYVLPHTVIREELDDWRGEFRERFAPVVAGCANAYDAAIKLDRTIWDMIGVHYNVNRDKARQSPRHSMRIGMASCTGISIILIDACRALGIPARLVGCNWTGTPGNHSWVEVYSRGRWRVVASGEKEREDEAWFLERAEKADPTRPDKRIYASRYSPSPEGTLFWQTWQHPQMVSDVPADDVTARYAPKARFAIVVSPETAAIDDWRRVANALADKHAGEAKTRILEVSPTNAIEALRQEKPRYVAFVMRSAEIDHSAGTLDRLKEMMRNIDSDPFDDAIWGIVTGPDARTALRIAASAAPRRPDSILATTGTGADTVPGPVTVLSDAYPKGEWWRKDSAGAISRHSSTNDLSGVFAAAWAETDPEMLLTSSHATERNLEMPFSQGMVVSHNGRFIASANGGTPLAEPKREKIWLAPGNCLIANHLDDSDMVMTALSFGKVNQFVGYYKVTWFGFAGWNTWSYFNSMGCSLAESHYAACQWLNWRLANNDWESDHDMKGLLWDRNATIFYGDPMQRITLREKTPGGGKPPELVIFRDSTTPHTPPEAPPGGKVFMADDFALILQPSHCKIY